MTFDEWLESNELYESPRIKWLMQKAWEAGWTEGLVEGYDKGYDDTGICPECLNEVMHKMDCGRGR